MISNDEVGKLELNNDEAEKHLRKKERRGIQRRKLIDTPYECNVYVNIVFEKHVS